MASPSKKQRLDSFVTEFTEELDTELKAVCYDISTKNGGPAIKAVEKIRRKVKAMEGKVKTLAKLNESENAKLVKENFEMKKEIENLQKKIKDLQEDDFYLSFDETKGPSDVATLASPEPSQGSTLSSPGLSQGSTVSSPVSTQVPPSGSLKDI